MHLNPALINTLADNKTSTKLPTFSIQMKTAVPLLILLVLFSCKKKQEPASVSIASFSLSQQSSTTANIQLELKITGDPTIIQQGVICTVDAQASFYNNKIAISGSGSSFSKTISVNSPNTTFYVRPYIITNNDTILGEVKSFTTGLLYSPGNPLVDVDGNSYQTIWINGQHWMAENLKTTSFANGNEMNEDQTLVEWQGETESSYYYVNFDENYNNEFGKLYNVYAIEDNRQVCPTGWHIPNNTDLTDLFKYLDWNDQVGGKLKGTGTIEDGTGEWYAPNGQANNYSGLNVGAGVPAYSDPTDLNYLYETGGFAFTEGGTIYTLRLNNHHGNYYTGQILLQYGSYIRCIED